jgi:type I restriction-modification system DNA methylase subunit
MSWKRPNQHQERLADALRRHGVEGEHAFYSLAFQYHQTFSDALQDIPESVVAKWSASYSRLAHDERLVSSLTDLARQDPKGNTLPDWYQFFIGRRFREGSGKFFTPRPVAISMAKLLPHIDNPIIMDPTCGGGTFLSQASLLWQNETCTLVGNDVEPSLVELTRLVLGLSTPKKHRRQYLNVNIFDQSNDLAQWHGRVNFILANPPFSLQIENEQFDSELFRAGYRNSDALFIDTALRLLAEGGQLVCLLPHSLIANRDFASMRSIVENRWNLLGVITLPEGVFHLTAGTTTRADIVILRKKGSSSSNGRKMFFASVPNAGVQLNGNSHRPDSNDLDRLLQEKEIQKVLGL